MASLTYLERIFGLFENAEGPLNQKFDEAGLARLVDWYAFKPAPMRHDSTPYGWFEVGTWPEIVQRPSILVPSDDPPVRFQVPVVVSIVFGAPSSAELQRLAARYVPRVMAALEGSRDGFLVTADDWLPGPNGSALSQFHQILFVVRGERRSGEI